MSFTLNRFECTTESTLLFKKLKSHEFKIIFSDNTFSELEIKSFISLYLQARNKNEDEQSG